MTVWMRNGRRFVYGHPQGLKVDGVMTGRHGITI